jgi:hypothetical protein
VVRDGQRLGLIEGSCGHEQGRTIMSGCELQHGSVRPWLILASPASPGQHLGALIAELADPWTAQHQAALATRRGHRRRRAAGAGPKPRLAFCDRMLGCRGDDIVSIGVAEGCPARHCQQSVSKVALRRSVQHFSPRAAGFAELQGCGVAHGVGGRRVGAALASHGRSHRFDPCHAHQLSPQVSTPLPPLGMLLAGGGEPISQQFPSSLRRDRPNHPAAAHRPSTRGCARRATWTRSTTSPSACSASGASWPVASRPASPPATCSSQTMAACSDSAQRFLSSAPPSSPEPRRGCTSRQGRRPGPRPLMPWRST